MGSNMPWLGKGSWIRKPQVSDDVRYNNFDKIFGVRYNWLETKKFKELLMLLAGDLK